MADEVRVVIANDADLVTARAEARAMAERLGFPRPDPTLIATAISEIARNIVVHSGRGEIVLRPFEDAQPLRPHRDCHRRGPGHPRCRGCPPRRLQRTRRPRPRAPGRAAPDGRVRTGVRRGDRHDRDDEEVAVPRRARAAPRGASPAWVSERARAGRVERREALPARRGDERRPRRRRRPAGRSARGRDRRPRARRGGRTRRPRGAARSSARAPIWIWSADGALPRGAPRYARGGDQPRLHLAPPRAG